MHAVPWVKLGKNVMYCYQKSWGGEKI